MSLLIIHSWPSDLLGNASRKGHLEIIKWIRSSNPGDMYLSSIQPILFPAVEGIL
jgi:hypothetical protein